MSSELVTLTEVMDKILLKACLKGEKLIFANNYNSYNVNALVQILSPFVLNLLSYITIPKTKENKFPLMPLSNLLD